MSFLRGADYRVRITTDASTAFVACERINHMVTAPALPVSNTEGVRGNPLFAPARGTEANIGDIVSVRTTLIMPSVDPNVNIWTILVLAPGDYCLVEIIGINSRDGIRAATAPMLMLYHQNNLDAVIPGKSPPSMTFVGDGVTAAEASLLFR